MTEDNNDNIKEDVKLETSQDIENLEGESETKEIKKLEEKEHYELEYFSKEDAEKELADLREKNEKLQKEKDESQKKYMHLQAEFENAQKRWDKNRKNLRTEYTASVLKNFLPLYDSFKKAMETADEAEKNHLNGFYNQFMGVFKSYGAAPIEVKANDSFDYSLHEALTSVEKEDIPENRVLEIIQDGFKYGKEVIRYTKVIISRKPKPPEPEPEPEEKAEEISDVIIESEEESVEEVESEAKKKKDKKEKKSKKE
jgi:molecular chaperone GrpE